MHNYAIGIDPGTNTGLAIWDCHKKTLLRVESGILISIVDDLRSFEIDCNAEETSFSLRIEDARQRTWYGKNSIPKMQGAGSIKRDCALWEEICEYHEWAYEMVHPIKGGTKWDAELFKCVTGWEGRTNQDARDAALLVWDL